VIKEQPHLALQADGVAQENPSREHNRTSTSLGDGIYGPVDGRRVDCSAIAPGPKLTDVHPTRHLPCPLQIARCARIQGTACCRRRRSSHSSSNNLQQISALHHFLLGFLLRAARFNAAYPGLSEL
jgi:hypothetical protein